MTGTIRPLLRIAAVIAAGAAVAALSGCASPTASAPGISATRVTVGAHVDLSGPDARISSAIAAGTSAYFDYINSKGGVNGRKLVYDVVDDGGDPSRTKSVVEDLVEKKQVFAVVGGFGTDTHAAAVDYLNERQVPDLFVQSGSPRWDDVKNHRWTFGYDADYIVEAKSLASYAQDSSGATTMCSLTENDEFGSDFHDGLIEILGPSGLVTAQTYAPGASDVTKQVASMKSSGCGIVFLATTDAVTAATLKTAARTGFQPMWLSSSVGGDLADVTAALGSSAADLMSGFRSTDFLPLDADDQWIVKFQQIQQQFGTGEFSSNTVRGMSVGYSFVEALQRAGVNPTRADLVHTLETGRVLGNGLMPLTFSTSTHSAYNGVGITEVKDGAEVYSGSTFLAAHGGSQVLDYYGKGIAYATEGIPNSP